MKTAPSSNRNRSDLQLSSDSRYLYYHPKRRTTLYFCILFLCLGIFIFINHYPIFQSNALFVMFFSFFNIIVTLVIGALSLIKYYTRNNIKYLIFGVGFWGFSLISLLFFLQVYPSSNTVSAIPMQIIYAQNLASMFFLGIFFVLSLIPWLTEKKHNTTSRFFIVSSCVLCITGLFVYFAALSLPKTFLIAFLSVSSLLFYTITAVGYLKKGLWKFKFFEHWFIVSCIFLITSQLFFIFSNAPYDSYFTIFYIFQSISYSLTLVGFMMSVYLAFNDVEESRNRIDTILQSIADGVFVVDVNKRIVLINKVAQRLADFPYHKSMGKTFTDLFSFHYEKMPETPYEDFISTVFQTGQAVSSNQKTILINRSKQEIPVIISASPIRDITDRILGCVTIIKDISRDRELEKTKDNFLSTAAHQLRTPIGSIRWNVEMLLIGDAGKIDKLARSTIESIYQNTTRMVAMVSDLLSVSRIDQERIIPKPKKVNLCDLIESSVKNFKGEIQAKSLTISPLVFKDTITVFLDPNHLQQVIDNVLSNAIKYNKPKGTVHIHLTKRDTHVDMEVTDTGIGIPNKDKHNLFSKFYRAQNARDTIADGSGLGLFVVKSYLSSWGGDVSIKSIEGKGTTVILHIPFKINGSRSISTAV